MSARTLEEIVTALQADFDARSVGASVVMGAWRPEEHAGADRVVLGLGSFDPDLPLASPMPLIAGPGPVLAGSAAASTLALRGQEYVVWVHGVAPAGTAVEDVVRLNHRRTGELLDATTAGLIRVVGRGSIKFGPGQWPKADVGDVTYGALCRFAISVAIPVRGDAYAVVPRPYTLTTEIKTAFPEGDETGATIETTGQDP